MVVSIGLGGRKGELTLLTGLVLLLIRRQQHVIWQGSPGHSSLCTHTMGFASKRSGTRLSVWQNDTALPLHINRACVWAHWLAGIHIALLWCDNVVFGGIMIGESAMSSPLSETQCRG